MKAAKKTRVQTSVSPIRKEDAPLVSLTLPGPEGKEETPLEPAVAEFASKLANRTLGGAWNADQARDAYDVWARGDRQARQSLVLMVEAYQAKLLPVEHVNMLAVTHAKEDSGRRFVFAFREMCGLLGQGGTDRQHYRSIKRAGKTIEAFDAPKSRGDSNIDKETSLLNRVGSFCVDLFKSGGAAAVTKLGETLAEVIEEVSVDGKYHKRK